MLLNLVLGAIAGYLTPIAAPHIKRVLEDTFQVKPPPGEVDYDMLSLVTLLLAAAILVWLFGLNSMAFPLVLGALSGLFGKQIYQMIMTPETAAEDLAPADEAPPDDAEQVEAAAEPAEAAAEAETPPPASAKPRKPRKSKKADDG
ncbi:hypothetical protein E2K80_02690 [Rhodophyticola sp. CCM32]|uniref:hypothetical protein n=1 Tax=Rhodophyticola sp. CCM32 TaxID=2916397 RepID=UPI00107F9FF3|nr:hypothetical protein [Rhodophyticola sp. CCM32]QBX99765.1 hypothetical protein E2K80_02690 [Rhodophyticola sp. CCM32]